jgi:ectoine hydroxylase-related dioxygenase (phytanoyl-CoA dioxygenase family)
MLAKAREQVRYRRALPSLVAPATQDPGYFSRFGGLWTDRRDAAAGIDRRLEEGAITADEAERLRHWIAHGYVILEQGVDPAVCDRLRADLDGAFADGDERLLMHSPAQEDYEPLRAGIDSERARVVDVYAFYESARDALFSGPIARFLETIFEDPPLLFQSLTFEKGSQQQMHQDTMFVITSSPLEFAASWIALEDIQPGSGELMYLDGSHRVPEYLFSGKYKHWNAKRDGPEGEREWRSQLQGNAERMGLQERTFLPKKGDVLIWSADLAHGGSPATDPSLTRKSLVGHYCPDRVDPFYFKLRPDRRGKVGVDGGRYSSYHYRVG